MGHLVLQSPSLESLAINMLQWLDRSASNAVNQRQHMEQEISHYSIQVPRLCVLKTDFSPQSVTNLVTNQRCMRSKVRLQLQVLLFNGCAINWASLPMLLKRKSLHHLLLILQVFTLFPHFLDSLLRTGALMRAVSLSDSLEQPQRPILLEQLLKQSVIKRAM